MTAVLIALAVVVLALLLARPGYRPPHRPVTEAERVKMLLKREKRQRRYAREHAERMRGYARKWPEDKRGEPRRSYALPFVAGGGR